MSRALISFSKHIAPADLPIDGGVGIIALRHRDAT